MTEDEIRLLSDIFSGQETKVPPSITEVPSISGLTVSQQKMRDTLREREEMREMARQKELSERSTMEKVRGAAEAGQFLGSTVGRSVLMPFAELGGQMFGQEGMGERLMESAPLPKSDLGLEYTVRAAEALEPVGKALEATKLPPVPFMPELLPLYSLPTFTSNAAKRATEATTEAAKGVSKAVKEEFQAAPVGAVQLQQPAAPRSDLGLYSNAEQAVLNLKQNKGTGNQFLAQITNTPGVKPAELEWTGLSDFLKSKGNQPVTKAEVADYLATNKVQVNEKQLLEPEDFERKINNEAFGYTDYSAQLNNGELDFYVTVRTGRDTETDEQIDFYDLPQYAQDALKEFQSKHGLAKFGPSSGMNNLVLPGGENYREILLTLPNKKTEYDKFLKYVNQKYGKGTPRAKWEEQDNLTYEKLVTQSDSWANANFRSPHFDEPNIVAHMRVDDRFDANGNKVLFVEELQSDWGQIARKEGTGEKLKSGWRMAEQEPGFFLLMKEGYSLPRAHGTREEVMKAADRMDAVIKGVPNAPFISSHKYQVIKDGKELVTKNQKGKDVLHIYDNPEDAAAAAKRFGGEVQDMGMQESTEDWVNLSIKRLITDAVNNDYKKVAFINGQQSADRYDLSKRVDAIAWERDPDGRITFTPEKDGANLETLTISADKLPEYIGKEIADKIASAKSDDGYLSGLDLKIGGEGMKKFYDQIIPNTVNKLLKKLGGGKLETVKLEDGLEQIGFTITPEMRELVKGGLPLFAKGGRVLAFAKGGEGDVAEFNRLLKKQDDEARLDSYFKQLNEEMEKTISDFQFGRATIEDVQRFFPGQSQFNLYRRFGNTDERTLKNFPSTPPSFKRLEEFEAPTESINEFGPDGRYRLEDELQAQYGGLISMKKGGSPLDAVIQAGKKAKTASDAKRREQRVQQNLEKYMGTKDKPKTYYHATQATDDFSVFDLERRPHPAAAKAVFVTPSPQWASEWIDADMKMLEKTGVPKPRVMPVITRAKNPFDYENTTHVNDVLNRISMPGAFSKEHVAEQISEGNWNFIEDRKVQQAIKDLGFDSFYVQERGMKNLGVFDPTDVKSLFNRGSYDPTTPDISKRKGGLACL